MKTIFKRICIHCGKPFKTCVINKFACAKCLRWSTPGKNQTKLF